MKNIQTYAFLGFLMLGLAGSVACGGPDDAGGTDDTISESDREQGGRLGHINAPTNPAAAPKATLKTITVNGACPTAVPAGVCAGAGTIAKCQFNAHASQSTLSVSCQ